eukprot:Colp12_sorted_trinity150504_noHs@33746
MVLRTVSPNLSLFKKYSDKPVRLVVKSQNFYIYPTSAEIVKQKLRERSKKPWIPINWSSSRTIISYDDMCPGNTSECLQKARIVGSKAANLGFMAQPEVLGRASQEGTISAKLGYDLTPFGFGVPFQYYMDFVTHPNNKQLRVKIEEYVKREKADELSPAKRKEYTAVVTQLIYDAYFPPELLSNPTAAVKAFIPSNAKKIKIRSSANAEDVPG